MNLTEGEKLQKLVTDYQQKYPNDPHPLDDAGFLSTKRLVKIMEEANGRKIRFIWDERKKHAMAPVDVVYED